MNYALRPEQEIIQRLDCLVQTGVLRGLKKAVTLDEFSRDTEKRGELYALTAQQQEMPLLVIAAVNAVNPKAQIYQLCAGQVARETPPWLYQGSLELRFTEPSYVLRVTPMQCDGRRPDADNGVDDPMLSTIMLGIQSAIAGHAKHLIYSTTAEQKPTMVLTRKHKFNFYVPTSSNKGRLRTAIDLLWENP